MNMKRFICSTDGCGKETFGFEIETIEILQSEGYTLESIKKMEKMCSKCVIKFMNPDLNGPK